MSIIKQYPLYNLLINEKDPNFVCKERGIFYYWYTHHTYGW